MKKNCERLVIALVIVFVSSIVVQGTSPLVYSYQYEYEAEDLEISARVPQLVMVEDLFWQEELNQSLRDYLMAFSDHLKEMVATIKEDLDYFFYHPYQGILDYDVKLNEGGLLSIALTNYVYTGGAHGITYNNYLNLDLSSKREIAFRDLFNTEEKLQNAASIISAEIANNPEQYFDAGFTMDQFKEEQDFYLLADKVVICFGLYELAPYVFGIQEFEVSVP